MLTKLLLDPMFHHDWQWWLRSDRPSKAHSVYPAEGDRFAYPVTAEQLTSLGIELIDDGWFYASDFFELIKLEENLG